MGGVSRGMRGTGGRSILARIPWTPHTAHKSRTAARARPENSDMSPNRQSWRLGAALRQPRRRRGAARGHTIEGTYGCDGTVGRAAEFDATACRGPAPSVVSTTRRNGRRGAEWPQGARRASYGSGPASGVQRGAADHSRRSSAGTSTRREPAPPENARPGPGGGGPRRARERAGARGFSAGDVYDEHLGRRPDHRRRVGFERERVGGAS